MSGEVRQSRYEAGVVIVGQLSLIFSGHGCSYATDVLLNPGEFAFL